MCFVIGFSFFLFFFLNIVFLFFKVNVVPKRINYTSFHQFCSAWFFFYGPMRTQCKLKVIFVSSFYTIFIIKDIEL